MDRRMYFIVFLSVCFTLAVGTSDSVRSKRSGISDQRLAELETLLALAKMRENARGRSVAYGIIDPIRLGKKWAPREYPEQDEESDHSQESPGWSGARGDYSKLVYGQNWRSRR